MFRFVRVSIFLGWLFAAGICAGGFLLTSFYLYLTPNLPQVEKLKSTQLQTPLRIYSSDNKSIAEFGEKRRTPIKIESAPESMVNAFIAAEDNRFFEHSGIDIKGLARAVVQLVSTGRIQSGGSTITMQVAKNFFLSREKTFIRKFNEIFLALRIEQTLSKPEILELYFNKIYLGKRAYGVEAAAQVYYGKSINELSLAQSAMIAGLPKAPSRYNPLANPKRAKERRNWILGRMQTLGMITTEQHQQASSEYITASYHGGKSDLYAPYIAEMARIEILNKFGSKAYTSGMKAYVTINSELQKTAQIALKQGLEAYDLRHGYRGSITNLTEAERNDPDTLNQKLKDTPTPSGAVAAYVESVGTDIANLKLFGDQPATLDLANAVWAKPFITVDRVGATPKKLSSIMQQGDIILVEEKTNSNGESYWRLHQAPDVQGALVSIAPQNGAIQALVGGYDFKLSHYNRATQAKRQPGSNFKAFIYLAALELGNSAATLINDAPIVFEDKNLEASWRPENSSGKFYGPTRLRKALYNSRNLVSIRLLKKIGVGRALKTIRKFGFSTKELPRDLSLALGSAAMTPLKIAAGYSMIANGGHKIKPYLLERVEDAEGNILYQADPLIACDRDCFTEDGEQVNQSPRISDERSVFILHSMLKDVITKGTGRRALALKRGDLAGKTGTTNDQKDAWFSGFNTELATTVWVGFDSPQTLGRREYGAKAALPVWNDFMAFALKGTEEAHMKRPEGIVTVRIDPETGEQAEPSTKGAIFEIFKQENIPAKSSHPVTNLPTATPGEADTISPEDIF